MELHLTPSGFTVSRKKDAIKKKLKRSELSICAINIELINLFIRFSDNIEI